MVTIYKIQCKDPSITDIYIGSTTDYRQRKNRHKYDCLNLNSSRYNCKIYIFIRENGGFENFEFKILNQIEYIDKVFKRQQEQSYIDCMKPTLNTHRAHSTNEVLKELHKVNSIIYRKVNKDKISEKQKKYREKNRERIQKNKKSYYEANKDAINERSRRNKASKKEKENVD